MSKAHFIGIAGVGMSATALILKDLGWEISGSDEGFYPPISTNLEKWGLPCSPHYAPENIPRDVDVIVIGKHAKLVPEENPEVAAALASGKPIKSFPEILGEITKDTKNIIVAGSYGKSTCAALLAWCLKNAGKDPSYFIGAVPYGFDATGHVGKDPLFILEGDEYPTSNFDLRSKFLFFNPHAVLLTPLAHDHVNIFPTLESYRKPFEELMMRIPKDGLVTASIQSDLSREIMQASNAPTVSYGLLPDAEWSADDIQFGKTTSFSLTHNGKRLITLKTKLLGRHNIENIVGVAALLITLKLLSPEEIATGIETFEGLARRLDLKTKHSSVLVYEGFGSSYDKAKSAIDAIRLHFPHKKLFVIFEPHTFSWRNRDMIHWYDDVFAGVGRVIIYKPPTHGAETHEQLSLKEIIERVQKAGVNAIGIEETSECLTILDHEVRESDIVLMLSSGNLDGLVAEIPAWADKKFPA